MSELINLSKYTVERYKKVSEGVITHISRDEYESKEKGPSWGGGSLGRMQGFEQGDKWTLNQLTPANMGPIDVC
jgi:hypothetical protein